MKSFQKNYLLRALLRIVRVSTECQMKYGVAAALLLGGCATPVTHKVDPYEQGILFARDIRDRCGEVQTPRTDEFINYLQSRLLGPLNQAATVTRTLEISLVGCNEPMAYAPGNGSVIISKGLARILPREAELAFVIAHEIAHERLFHPFKLQNETLAENRATLERSLEIEADKYALGIVASAGYDPRAAFDALTALHGHDFFEVGSVNYPSLSERHHAVKETIEKSGWEPPGTIDRREYQKFRLALKER